MPRTKPKPTPQPVQQPGDVNGTPGEVLTLAEVAAYLRLPECEIGRLVHSQGLPGRLVGGEWRFLKTAIQQWLGTGGPTAESRKAGQLSIAGKYKDDPDLEQIVEEAYRRRGRPITEDGSYKNFSG